LVVTFQLKSERFEGVPFAWGHAIAFSIVHHHSQHLYWQMQLPLKYQAVF